MVGSAIVRRLATENFEILSVDRSELDLMEQHDVREGVAKARPDIAVLAAAKVGGILANNDFPADFLYQNLVIETNIIDASQRSSVTNLLFWGSSCIYPKFAKQLIVEESLLTGSLEPTNEWYAVVKIAGIKIVQACRRQYCRDYIAAMPTNLMVQAATSTFIRAMVCLH